ncbi:type IV pili twitching motility protein PilT [Candidatus Amesbacteria bacterium RIFCSPHIGHO2_02_FULL_48_21]|uniref:Twitching motility protein n=2 Tax=Patescibacteria group TaxID=1783273 RepID=A0A0G1XF88_9BACT|nr:MAG: twitching motility protein [Candidatus Amesbacteria bacterium GW2011_GWC1_48_10]KKW29943.1 MAG: twitching motility protein [Candidatus Kaiserbacteria bacterium GW2011_GWC2_52_8b]OGC89105.1 MAG: type IV pili twitching motility protein PilT [Candidatus Amesbacteria bacterium RBG_19FT_COMBO_48_16]OGC95371.1 MAG: type IV pili twitching motility protein PilT [Candidatus Amesbacteria bacterium RIFCSPHIGHO2_02_FULL_48_21]OGC98645.1 MAG: type IV pili twitching motility protein PilT [Candidatus 
MTIQQLLQYTIQHGCSDLHLVVGSPPIVRKDGSLVAVAGEEKLTDARVEQLVAGVMSTEQKQILLVNKEIDFSFSYGDEARFRVNAYFQRNSQAASFRWISAKIPMIDSLGLPKIAHDFAILKQGFVLVTGPTGHGKSTTLAAILEEINQTRPVHVVTIEDPIEYVYTSAKGIVSQREVHNDTHSWEIALRSVLREDPDVVLIGEMRDFETIAAALTIAETGHLVFATLHTNSAAQTMDRIVDVFPENQQPQVRAQLSANLEAVLSQRLIPRIGGGRVLAYEIMVGTSAVRTAIREGRTHMLDNIIMTSAEYGMVPLEGMLARLVREGVITLEVAQAYAIRPADVARYVKGGE